MTLRRASPPRGESKGGNTDRHGLLNVVIIPAIVVPIVLGVLSRTRTWALALQALLAIPLVVMGIAMGNEPFQWIQQPPRDLGGGFHIDVQLATTQIGGVLLALWAGVWLLVSLVRRAFGRKGPRPPEPGLRP